MNYEEKLEEMQSFATRYIKSIAMDFVVVLVALSYVFYKMITFDPTYLNPFVLLAEAIMGIICGVTIKQALGENGFSKGYNSKYWNDEEKLYNDACNVALPYMDRTDNYYQYEIINKKKDYRRQHLQEVRLKYDQWFDKDGNYIGLSPKELKKRKVLDRKQLMVLNRCIKVRIIPLNLFSQYTISTDQYTRKEPTDKMQRGRNATKNTLTATVIAIIGVYFIPQLKGWNWGDFISATMQVTMWVLFGILQLYTNYNFVVKDLVSVLRKKKEEIKRFVSNCNKGMYLVSPYDDAICIEPKAEIDQDLIEKLMNQRIMPTPSLEPNVEPIDNNKQ